MKKFVFTALAVLATSLALASSASADPAPLAPGDCPEGWQPVDPQTLNFVIRCLPDNIAAPDGPGTLPSAPAPLDPGSVCPPGWEPVDPQTLNFVIRCLPDNIAAPDGPGGD